MTPSPLTHRFAPMLAVSGAPFDSPDHFFEVKWDGIRAIAYIDGTRLSLVTRNGGEASVRFPELASVVSSFRSAQAVIDGEIVVMDQSGRPDFDAARARNALRAPAAVASASRTRPAVYVVFDCLVIDGKEIIARPFTNRRDVLLEHIRPSDSCIASHGVLHRGRDYFDAVCGQGLEGIVAKELASMYRPGARSPSWIKVRNVCAADCVVGGFVPQGIDGLKCLAVGLFDGRGALRYLGRVGSGFSVESARALRKRLDQVRIATPPFDVILTTEAKDTVWVRPRIVCTVEYLRVNENGRLRHPVFKGLRFDKRASECGLESELSSRRPRSASPYAPERKGALHT